MHYGFWNFAGDHPVVDVAFFMFVYYIVAELTNIRVSIITHRSKTGNGHAPAGLILPQATKGPRLPDPPEEHGVKKGGA